MEHKEHDLSFSERLGQEIELWLKEGLIAPEQKEKILARYSVLNEAEKKAGPGKLVTTISILGSILVGVGIILFIASNWSEIPRWGKLAIIFSSMLTCYGLGFYIRYERQNYPKVGAALLLLGSLIFGAGIFLIAQIYHITVHYPNGPLMWGLGVLPLAYLLRLRSLMVLAIIDLLIWLGMESSLHVFGYFTPMPLVTLYLMAGVTLWGIGLTHKGIKSLESISSPYRTFGLITTFLAGFILTFNVYTVRLGADELYPFYTGAFILFFLAIIVYLRSGSKEKGWLPETLSLFFIMITAFLLSFFFIGNTPSIPGAVRKNSFDLYTFISNIIFAGEIIGIIFLGYIRRNNAYINIGLLFFVFDVTARYFDFFWKLLPRSLFFIIGGIILLIGSVVLERKRRKILASFALEETR